ncbi:hypothetical protein O181_011024 [Austropuccinia psidii MF-1]|uniref:Uncharacterized protein n=1 Tax=Austropuccinia psidii MF-1 TaxID=1389203 RepID=A0A9Q3GLG3_9BASI|nr:hypothetical protein [Austropuccinia psidii MF-1]
MFKHSHQLVPTFHSLPQLHPQRMYQVSTLMWEIPQLQLQASCQSPTFPLPQSPKIPLIHKCMCLRGQDTHLKSHQRLSPNQNFHMSSSLILVRMQSPPRNPLCKVDSQPSIFHQDLRFMWAMKSSLMGGDKKDHWEMLLVVIWNLKASQSDLGSQANIVSDGLYASLPLVHKEKFTGCHHPYSSKSRTAYASSSREKIVNDEHENMSPNHSETNDEPRRDNFMVHEEGTQSNIELTHPQMPLSQGILEKSKIRQQRNQAEKAHNVAKCTSQKEKQRWLKGELPESVHGMRSAVHSHWLFLLKVRDKAFSSLPTPPCTEEHEIAIQVAGHL